MSRIKTSDGSADDCDVVHITFEDQRKINKFAQLSSKLGLLKTQIKQNEGQLTSLNDANDEIELLDDDVMIPYLVGEVFIYQDSQKTVSCIEEEKGKLELEIQELISQTDDIKETLSDLKVYLYGKFGTYINLETEDE